MESMKMPFFGALFSVGQTEFGDCKHFNMGTLFWSLTRLFGCYERIMTTASNDPKDRPFLDADIENFFIRFRIVLNDTAFVVWQFFPPATRGLKGPRGGTHPKNKEVSFFTLAKYILKEPTINKSLAKTFEDALSWASRLRDDRDNLVHYKSQVIVFNNTPTRFAFVNAAGTERRDQDSELNAKLHLEPVETFVNEQMLYLHDFLNTELTNSIIELCDEFGYKHSYDDEPFGNPTISCIGINGFLERNSK